MKRIVIILILLIFLVGIYHTMIKEPHGTVSSSLIDKQKEIHEVKSINQHSEHLHTTHTVDEKLVTNGPSDHSEEATHVHSPETASNSAAQFNKLPKEMQKEIKQLSGRNNPNIQPIEVEPGVFLIPAGKGVNVVPVAVINDDGTLSIHEY